MVKRRLTLRKLRLDGDTQPRASIDDDVVEEYAVAYRAGAKIPAIVVFFDGVDHWLADGFHRWHAANSAGVKTIACDIRKGTREDARWFSYSANQAHGVRRTSDDKAKAVRAALKHPKGVKLGDTGIAEHVGVTDKTVAKYRAELQATSEIPESPARTGRDGRTIDTTNIGRAPKNREVPPELDAPEGPVPEEDSELAGDGAALRDAVQAAIDKWCDSKHSNDGVSIASVLRDLADEYRE